MEEATGATREFRSDQYGVSFQYPGTWDRSEQQTEQWLTVNFFSPDAREYDGKKLPEANVAIQFIPSDMTRDELFASILRKKQSMSELPEYSRLPSVLGGEPAIREIAEGEADGARRRVILFMTARDGTVYSLIFTADLDAFPYYESAFEDIVESFTFIGA